MSDLKLFLIGSLFFCGFFNSSYAISPVLESNESTEFFELDDIDAHKDFVSTKSFVRDTIDRYSNPACELYNYSWTSERLNPYRIKIDSLPDKYSSAVIPAGNPPGDTTSILSSNIETLMCELISHTL